MPFERFVPPTLHGRPALVTLRPSGLISFDSVAVVSFELDQHSHAVLYYDRASKRIGVGLTNDANEVGSLPLSARRSSVNLKAPAFFRQIGLVLSHPRRLQIMPDPESELLEIDLSRMGRRMKRR